MKEFDGRVAVVTGAASGIGRALAVAFAAEGMKVVLADVEETPLLEATKELTDGGAEALAVRTDVTQPGDLKNLAERALDQFGAVHVLCNNAGVFAAGKTWEAPFADYEWMMNVNTWGVLHGIQAFVPLMLTQDTECHIVNTSSMAGVTIIPFVTGYHISKHAVMALSECLFKELEAESSKIGVSVLCPEVINTNIGYAERNRPADPTRDPDRLNSPIGDMVTKGLIAQAEQGLAPSVMADRVLAAIRENRFYILAEDATWVSACNARLDDIKHARNPRSDTLEL